MKSTRDNPTEEPINLPLKKRKMLEHADVAGQQVVNPLQAQPVQAQPAQLQPAQDQPVQLATSNAGFFKMPYPVVRTAPKHPMQVALETHFALMDPAGLKPYHYSEVLREIAAYHRDHSHPITPEEKDIIAMTLFLFEKATVIEPNNTAATLQLSAFAGRLKLTDEQQHEVAMRYARYKSECAEKGYRQFFLIALNKYLERLQLLYKDNTNVKFVDVCRQLSASATILHMRNKHMTTAQQQASVSAFDTAIQRLTPQQLTHHF